MIFDYWLDLNGVVPPFLKKDKPIYVFSSHFHEDHFNSMKEFTAEKGIPFWEISSEGETITIE